MPVEKYTHEEKYTHVKMLLLKIGAKRPKKREKRAILQATRFWCRKH